MSMGLVQKEDLRDRMADLEKRLAESEEERNKLEKTCNVLMKAFREEERMQYKALNKKYEKFLEDCSLRKRRNDIILRSLCRIEDRSRVLFAKTERLKLLKNRYISDLKINEYSGGKKEYSESWRSFPTPSQKITGSFVKWTSPLETHNTKKPTELREDSSSQIRKQNLSHSHLTVTGFEKSEDKSEEEKRGGKSEVSNFALSRWSLLDPVETDSDRLDSKVDEQLPNQMKSMTYFAEEHILSDKPAAEVISAGEREVTNQNESVDKSEKAPSFERDSYIEADDDGDETCLGKTDEDDTGQNESLFLSNFATSTKCMNAIIEGKKEKEESKLDEENVLPMGLDGVDYQNETYPESYYEQPVHHHNHTSIASDVILEEDETEQELDEDEESVIGKSPGNGAFGEPQRKWEINAVVDEADPKGCETNGKTFMGDQSLESESESSLEAKHSEEKEKLATDSSDKNRTKVKSSLIHLLESDSESFQIEHGDVVTGNEDSDFDFSFNQN